MLFGGPVLVKEFMKVSLFDILVLLCPRQMTTLHLKAMHSCRGFWVIISDNGALYDRRDTHELIAWDTLVVMVVSSV